MPPNKKIISRTTQFEFNLEHLLSLGISRLRAYEAPESGLNKPKDELQTLCHAKFQTQGISVFSPKLLFLSTCCSTSCPTNYPIPVDSKTLEVIPS